MGCSRTGIPIKVQSDGSNNTNKWDAQEQRFYNSWRKSRSNNTNKWDAQEQIKRPTCFKVRSNNTNKWNAQERPSLPIRLGVDQIIPINGMLKNPSKILV